MAHQTNPLTGKVALVTGAAGGIGSACVRTLADAGASVLATDLDGKACEAVAFSLQAHDLEVVAMQPDVCDESRWRDVIDTAITKLGGLDIVVNNAGIYMGGTLESNTLEQVNRVHAVNVDSIFLGMKYSVEVMKPEGRAGQGDGDGSESTDGESSASASTGSRPPATRCSRSRAQSQSITPS